jgi:Integrase core domain
VESFNGTFRAECLDAHWFADLNEAKQYVSASWWTRILPCSLEAAAQRARWVKVGQPDCTHETKWPRLRRFL